LDPTLCWMVRQTNVPPSFATGERTRLTTAPNRRRRVAELMDDLVVPGETTNKGVTSLQWTPAHASDEARASFQRRRSHRQPIQIVGRKIRDTSPAAAWKDYAAVTEVISRLSKPLKKKPVLPKRDKQV